MSLSGDKRTDRKRIIVGVSGGIAAYKACTVVRQLTEAGHQVRVIPTESALRFVGAATFEALSGQPVQTGVFEDVPQVPHVAIGQGADLVVLEPASGRLTGADSGAGRLPEAEEITTFAELLLDRHDAMPYDLAGVKLLVTAGGTR